MEMKDPCARTGLTIPWALCSRAAKKLTEKQPAERWSDRPERTLSFEHQGVCRLPIQCCVLLTAKQQDRRISALSPGWEVLMDGCEELRLGWGERWAMGTHPPGLFLPAALSQAKWCNHREGKPGRSEESWVYPALCIPCLRELPGLWGLDFLKGEGTSKSEDSDSIHPP